MKRRSDQNPEMVRESLIGLGEHSIRKTYYPELQRRKADLERFRHLIDAVDVTILVLEVDHGGLGRLSDMNRAAEYLLGQPRQALLDRMAGEVLPIALVEALEDGRWRKGLNAHAATECLELPLPGGGVGQFDCTVTEETLGDVRYLVVLARNVSRCRYFEQALQDSEAQLRALYDHSTIYAGLLTPDGCVARANRAALELFGSEEFEVIGQPLWDTRWWKDFEPWRTRVREATIRAAQGETVRFETPQRSKDGGVIHLDASFKPIRNELGQVVWVLVEGMDITSLKLYEHALTERTDTLEGVLRAAPVGIAMVRANRFIQVNDRLLAITGHTRQDMEGMEVASLFASPQDVEIFKAKRAAMKRDRTSKNAEVTWRRHDGSSVDVLMSLAPLQAPGDPIILTALDITQRKRMEVQLRHMALHDPLTGLANRTMLKERVNNAMSRARRGEKSQFALLFIDLDRFKVINDSLGHALGDQILVQFAQRLTTCVRSADSACRYGGDEFVVLLEELPARQAICVAKRIREELKIPFAIGGHAVTMTASIGIELNPARGSSPDDIIRNANLAMHHAKQKSRDAIMVFNRRLLSKAMSAMLIEKDMAGALDRGEFFLVFQPIVDVHQNGAIIGLEALVRWLHPERGLIPPGNFIPVAEETGRILKLGEWIAEAAFAAAAHILERFGPNFAVPVSINVSPRQLASTSTVACFRRLIEGGGVPARLIRLEITETAVVSSEAALDNLTELKKLGLSLSMDDFGSGYSNLSLLSQLQLDTMKIDLGLVQGMLDTVENASIIKAIVTMAESLGLSVIAEGVETEEQRDMLAQYCCRLQQGYLHSRPLPLDEVLELLAAGKAQAPSSPQDLPVSTERLVPL